MIDLNSVYEQYDNLKEDVIALLVKENNIPIKIKLNIGEQEEEIITVTTLGLIVTRGSNRETLNWEKIFYQISLEDLLYLTEKVNLQLAPPEIKAKLKQIKDGS